MRLRVRRIVVLVAQIIKNAVTFVTIINGVHQSADRDQSAQTRFPAAKQSRRCPRVGR
jgi:hypothetical protein